MPLNLGVVRLTSLPVRSEPMVGVLPDTIVETFVGLLGVFCALGASLENLAFERTGAGLLITGEDCKHEVKIRSRFLKFNSRKNNLKLTRSLNAETLAGVTMRAFLRVLWEKKEQQVKPTHLADNSILYNVK